MLRLPALPSPRPASADRVAIVADQDRFYGIITRIDLINFLRKRML